jgi:protein-S-isoprenylcysteine O-methyltransferase Ste14
VRIPPPLIAVTLVTLMVGGSRFVEPLWPVNGFISFAALLLVAAGTVIDVSSKRLFSRLKTTVNPMTPGAAAAMVKTGAYRWSRNPMYLGRIMQLFALALYLASWIGFFGVLLFAVYLDRVQIQAEEQALARRFPREYADYMSRVRRWL